MKWSRGAAFNESSWHDFEHSIKRHAITYEQLAYAHLARRGCIEKRPAYVDKAKHYYPQLLRFFCAKQGKITDSYYRYWPEDRESVIYAITTSKDEIWIRYFPDPCQYTERMADIENMLWK